jgi:hypothetical protein
MGAFDFTWNAIQSGQIRELEEQNQILYEWVQYFRAKEKENDTKS